MDHNQVTYDMSDLFETEACPFCRRVREALTELDLSAEVPPALNLAITSDAQITLQI